MKPHAMYQESSPLGWAVPLYDQAPNLQDGDPTGTCPPSTEGHSK